MSAVVKFDCQDDFGVFRANKEIYALSIDSVISLMEFLALLDAKEPRKLDLRQDDVVGQGAYQSEVENLLGGGQWLLRIKRLRSFDCRAREPYLEDS